MTCPWCRKPFAELRVLRRHCKYCLKSPRPRQNRARDFLRGAGNEFRSAGRAHHPRANHLLTPYMYLSDKGLRVSRVRDVAGSVASENASDTKKQSQKPSKNGLKTARNRAKKAQNPLKTITEGPKQP